MSPHDFYILSKDGKYVKDINAPTCILVDDVLFAFPYDREHALLIAKMYDLDVEHFEVEIHIVSKGMVDLDG